MLVVVNFIVGVLLFVVSKDVTLQNVTQVIGCLAIVFSVSVYFLEKELIAWLTKKKKINDNLIVQKKNFWYIVWVIALFVLLKGLSFYLVFIAINYPVSFEHSLLVASLVLLSNMVSILPGNIGIRELLMGGILQLFGYDLSFIILASLVDRATVIIITTLGAIIFKYILSKELESHG